MNDDIIRFIVESAVRGRTAGASIRAVHIALGELAEIREEEFAERWREYHLLREEKLRRLGRFLKERGRTAEAAACLQGKE